MSGLYLTMGLVGRVALRVNPNDAMFDLLYARWRADRDVDGEDMPFEADAVRAMLLHDWQDNLRGVDTLVHRLARRTSSAPIAVEELGLAAAPEPALTAPKPDKVPPPKSREELEVVMAQCGGSVHATARHYGRDRRQVYRWLDAFGMREKKG